MRQVTAPITNFGSKTRKEKVLFVLVSFYVELTTKSGLIFSSFVAPVALTEQEDVGHRNKLGEKEEQRVDEEGMEGGGRTFRASFLITLINLNLISET